MQPMMKCTRRTGLPRLLIRADTHTIRYPLSKLLEIIAVRQLATLIPVSRTGVVMNLICPGLCSTDLSRNAPPAFRENLANQLKESGRTAEDGSRTLLHGAVAGKESHGCHISSCEIAE